jgi:hypothetical protein
VKGLEARYEVKKINDPEGKHDNCWVFVLDPKHDPHAVNAIIAYAESIQAENPVLARDLGNKVLRMVGEALLDATEEPTKPEVD